MELWQKGQATGEIWPASTSESQPPDCRSPALFTPLFVPGIKCFVLCVLGLPPKSHDQKKKYLITVHLRDRKYWVKFHPEIAQVTSHADSLKIKQLT